MLHPGYGEDAHDFVRKMISNVIPPAGHKSQSDEHSYVVHATQLENGKAPIKIERNDCKKPERIKVG